MGEAIPLVAYTQKQEAALNDVYFRCLLSGMGFELPEPCNVASPLVSSDVRPSQLGEMALLLTPSQQPGRCLDPLLFAL